MLRFFEYLGHLGLQFLDHLGKFIILIYRTASCLGCFFRYSHLIKEQMLKIGVNSLPLVAITSAFTGMVTSVQAAYQFESYTPLYFVGAAVSKSVVIELAPVLTALVLAGRVGASITAEIGTMRVTEQLDALETLAVNPVRYLVVPRVVSGLVMTPVLVIFADLVGIVGGWLVAIATLRLSTEEFVYGMRMVYRSWDVTYGLIKAVIFGLLITAMGCYQGFHCGGGAEGVGRATTNSVVASSVLILILDYVVASILL